METPQFSTFLPPVAEVSTYQNTGAPEPVLSAVEGSRFLPGPQRWVFIAGVVGGVPGDGVFFHPRWGGPLGLGPAG